jgi:hypothetical protein
MSYESYLLLITLPVGEFNLRFSPCEKCGFSPKTARLRFFDENYKEEDAINRRQYEAIIIVETAIYRVSYPNRTVLGLVLIT